MAAIDLPQAKVRWWNDREITVQCPHCEADHTHTTVGDNLYGSKSYQRPARCLEQDRITGASYDSYQVAFPFDDKGYVAWGIDKKRCRFVDIGMAQPCDHEDTSQCVGTEVAKGPEDPLDPCGLADALTDLQLTGGRALSEPKRLLIEYMGAREEKQVFLFDKAISDCVLGNLDGVKQYLDTVSEEERAILLYGGSEGGDSSSALIYAAAGPTLQRGGSSVVPLLLENRVNVDDTNLAGRTALMEAALWGRAVNVRLLLEDGANVDKNDASGRRAIDLATPSERNVAERYRRSDQGVSYKENTYEANKSRGAIVRMLQPGTLINARDPASSYLRSRYSDMSRFAYDPANLATVLLSVEKAFPVAHKDKTIARMDRGHPFTPVYAMSGWSHDNEVTISGRRYTDGAIELAETMDCTLPCNWECDQGIPGQHSASHAEKQLLAYLVERHKFLKAERGKSEELQRLCNIKPGGNLGTVCMLVIRPICSNCEAFIQQFEVEARITVERRCASC